MAVLESSLTNLRHQLLRFQSGDGLNTWTREVGSVIGRSFPEAEFRNFGASRQSRGLMHVPHWLSTLLGNAAATGMLSGPHDRYQNRIIWLAMIVPLILGFRLWSWAVQHRSQRRPSFMGAAPGCSIPYPCSKWRGCPWRRCRPSSPGRA